MTVRVNGLVGLNKNRESTVEPEFTSFVAYSLAKLTISSRNKNQSNNQIAFEAYNLKEYFYANNLFLNEIVDLIIIMMPCVGSWQCYLPVPLCLLLVSVCCGRLCVVETVLFLIS